MNTLLITIIAILVVGFMATIFIFLKKISELKEGKKDDQSLIMLQSINTF